MCESVLSHKNDTTMMPARRRLEQVRDVFSTIFFDFRAIIVLITCRLFRVDVQDSFLPNFETLCH